MRFTKLAIVHCLVTEQAGDLGRDLVDDGVPAVRIGLGDQCPRLREGALSLGDAAASLGA
jgi:hypothetical protein